jgi:Flp pilus assembly protein TadG
MIHKPSLKNAERGQSLIEMAIGSVILIMIVMGILDLGRLYFLYVALEDGAGEAALYLSINPDCPDSEHTDTDGHACTDPKNAEYRALNSGGDETNSFVDWSMAEFDYDVPSETGTGVTVQVTIAYPYRAITPLIGAITRNSPIMLTVSAAHTILQEQ